MTRGQKRLGIILGILIIMAISIWTGNNRLHVSRYEIGVAGLDPAFDGLTIVQISDLHSKFFGNDQRRLAKKVGDLHPDIIFCTGDMVDSRKYREEPVYALVEKLVKVAPVYMVSGNHEWWTAGGYQEMIPRLEALGAHVLENKADAIERDGARLWVVGLSDEAYIAAEAYYGAEEGRTNPGEPLAEAAAGEDYSGDTMDTALLALLADRGAPVLLLSHRPEYFPLYVQSGADVVFSGHAHGGQIRIPFVGGIIAPGQGFFPRYDGGVYREGATTMVVSRGLGNSLFPLRVFNPPDVVYATLRAD